MTAQLAPLASDVNTVALGVLIALFLLVTVLGFMATPVPPRRTSLDTLDEWGLGGRKFGTWVTWFLLGGDLYTAYTFVAVPAAMFATGAVAGFFAVPYTIILYPIIFIFMARLWSVSHRHGYVTTADFVRGRYDARGLSPRGRGHRLHRDDALHRAAAGRHPGGARGGRASAAATTGSPRTLPLFIAFALLAAYTYSSGLRAPAVIAFVKDTLIYLVIIVAIIYLPGAGRRLGRDLRRGRGEDGDAPTRPPARPTGCVHPGRRPGLGLRHARRWARRWRCSCTRTRSPRACPRAAATRSGATPRSCRRTPSCWACSRCSAGSRSRPAPSRSASTVSPTRSW